MKKRTSITLNIMLFLSLLSGCSIFQKYYKIEIKGAPPKAEIFLDDDKKGVVENEGKFTIEDVKPGYHVVRVTSQYFTEYKQNVNGNAGETKEVIVKSSPK